LLKQQEHRRFQPELGSATGCHNGGGVRGPFDSGVRSSVDGGVRCCLISGR
jgi:hypothetical protein